MFKLSNFSLKLNCIFASQDHLTKLVILRILTTKRDSPAPSGYFRAVWCAIYHVTKALWSGKLALITGLLELNSFSSVVTLYCHVGCDATVGLLISSVNMIFCQHNLNHRV